METLFLTIFFCGISSFTGFAIGYYLGFKKSRDMIAKHLGG